MQDFLKDYFYKKLNQRIVTQFNKAKIEGFLKESHFLDVSMGKRGRN